MGELNMGGIKVGDTGEGPVNLPLAIAGGAGGGIVLGLVYGFVSTIVGEWSYVSFLIGAGAGIAALKLGKGRSVVSGAIAAVCALVGVLLGKMIFLMPPPPVTFMDYHFTMFDIIFCYVLNPAAAFFAAGTDKARDLLKMIPGM